MSAAREVNFDGLVGPTHSYAGLSLGNVASTSSRASASDPCAAALQGLDKMRLLHDLGVEQAVLPPHERPSLWALGMAGFSGEPAEVLGRVAREDPGLLAACASASAMWTANAATVAPSADTDDGRVHFVPANLEAKLHRAIEVRTTARALAAVFADEQHFAHHAPLAGGHAMADEGAANHLRLARQHGMPGLHVLVYGRDGDGDGDGGGGGAGMGGGFPARQTQVASAAVGRLLALPDQRRLLVRQARVAVDAGVFHNDVISVANEGFLLHHEDAFAGGSDAVTEIGRRYESLAGAPLLERRVRTDEVSLADAVGSYLFNSQLVTLPDGAVIIIAPAECEARPAVRHCIERIIGESANPLAAVRYVDLHQSMRNGGGPACLRLRVVLTDAELAAVAPGVRFGPTLHERLAGWVRRHYRDRLAPGDLADPELLDETYTALEELTRILGLPPLYDFQR